MELFKEVMMRKSVGHICDICGKEYPLNIGFNVHAMHFDWCENESSTSLDACSPKCFTEVIKKHLDDFEEYENVEIAGFDKSVWEYIIKERN